MSGREVGVYELRVGDARNWVRLMAGAMRRFPGLRFYNADIAPDRYWLYETGLFPLARVSAVLDGGEWAGIAPLDSAWDPDPEPPPLAVMDLRLEGPGLNPVHGGVPGAIEVRAGGDTRVLDGADPAAMLGRLDALLDAAAHRWVPGVHTWFDVPGLFELPGFGDRGFRPELQDPWAVTREQIGHLLTALAMAMYDARTIPVSVFLCSILIIKMDYYKYFSGY